MYYTNIYLLCCPLVNYAHPTYLYYTGVFWSTEIIHFKVCLSTAPGVHWKAQHSSVQHKLYWPFKLHFSPQNGVQGIHKPFVNLVQTAKFHFAWLIRSSAKFHFVWLIRSSSSNHLHNSSGSGADQAITRA